MHHPRSSVERLYLSRKVGGRGLLNLETLCRNKEQRLRTYFVSHGSLMHQATCNQDHDFTSLHLRDENDVHIATKTQAERLQTWREKPLHGRFAAELTAEHVDLKESTEWLRTAGLFSETEGFLLAIQDQVVRTRNYERHILKTAVDDRCRLCKKPGETIQHITGGCSVLAPKEYLERHNAVAKVVHQALAKQHGLVETETPYYKCKPEQVMQNHDVKILWDSMIVTDRAVEANRPDLVLIDKKEKTAIIIDIAVPLDNHVVTTCAEKRRKYQPLAVELKHMYRLREVTIVPVVVSVNGLVNSDWKSARKLLQLKQKHMRIMQKAAILGTANIVRKVLNL
ncbi:hypothetical protein B566_EDAN016009 [Ephemera danica]|nr:hypothetical protein B566_EDAN016009 [Ephemera danica]